MSRVDVQDSDRHAQSPHNVDGLWNVPDHESTDTSRLCSDIASGPQADEAPAFSCRIRGRQGPWILQLKAGDDGECHPRCTAR